MNIEDRLKSQQVFTLVYEEIMDHVVWHEQNRSGSVLSIVARLRGPRVSNVQYTIRLEPPSGDGLSFMLTLEGFKELGELLIALHDFCKAPIFANERNVEILKKLLTCENIKNYTKISALKSPKRQE